MALDEPIFIESDPAVIITEMVAYYEDAVGFKLSPGQAEMLLIQAFAYREQLLRVQANEAAKQNLLAFARYPMIDYLGELVGVSRLPASKASASIQFNLVTGHPALVIPAGIRIQSIDGKVVFVTLTDKTVLVSDTTVSVLAECTTEGAAGNLYEVGEISIILDPQAYVSSASNLSVTAGGADAENDDGIRERIRLAPSSFSCAGPDDAYVYFAKSAHPLIIDVGIMSPIPGQVNVYPLLENAETPSIEILNAVDAKLNPRKVRPLNDTVVVAAPTKNEYTIEVNVTLLTGAIESAVEQQILKNLTIYADDRKKKLGRDAVLTQIIAKTNIDEVYEVELLHPTIDITTDFSQVAFCTAISVNIIGYSDE